MRVGAGVLLRDPIGRVLLVEPTSKDDGEIPGGRAPGVGPSPARAGDQSLAVADGRRPTWFVLAEGQVAGSLNRSG